MLVTVVVLAGVEGVVCSVLPTLALLLLLGERKDPLTPKDGKDVSERTNGPM